MFSLMELLHDGGPLMYALIALLMLGAMGLLITTALGLMRHRIPAVVWLVAPLLMVWAGLLGTLQGVILASDAISYASLEMRGVLAHAGYSVALVTKFSGLFLASVLLVLGAWGAAVVAALRPGPDATFRPLGGVLGGGLVTLVGVGLVGWAAVSHTDTAIIGGVLVASGPALALAGLREGGDPADRSRSGEGRVAVMMCVLGAVLSMGLFSYVQGSSGVHRAIAMASAEMRTTLVAVGVMQQSFAWMALVVGGLSAILGGLASVGGLWREALSGRTVVSVTAVGAGVLVAGVIQLLSASFTLRLTEAWPEPSLLGLRAEVPDLPVDEDFSGEEGYSQVPSFGHLLVSHGDDWEWRRGAEQLPATLPLDGVEPHILLAAPASMPAWDLVEETWSSERTDLSLVVQRPLYPEAAGELWLEPGYLGAVTVQWEPSRELTAEAYHTGDVVVLDGSDAEIRISREGHPQQSADTLAQAAGLLADSLDDDVDTVAVIPSPSWTVQDLVRLSSSLREHRIGVSLIAGASIPVAAPSPSSLSTALGGGTEIRGMLSKEQIDQVMRRSMNQIKYCYQRELARSGAGLSGRVTVKFTIASSGSVASAAIKESTLGSEAVESCVLGRINRLRFPEPAGGGIVIVNYPFVFQQAD